MNPTLPRQRLPEFLLEVTLTGRKHVVVEGRTDERFLRVWVQNIPNCPPIAITPVENLDIPQVELEAYGLPDGNRGRVLVTGAYASKHGAGSVRCVADRDCGQNVAEFDFDTVLWTDYPALESYAVTENILDTANLLSFGGHLPEGSDLLPSLSFALREIFAVRLRNHSLPKPNYGAGLPNRSGDLSEFDVSATVSPKIRSKVGSYDRPDESLDARLHSYGHDIAELLLAAFANALKNKAGLRTVEAVEGALRSAIQAEGSFTDQPLFKALREWVESG